MITAAQPHPFPLRCFNRRLAAGRERSRQSHSPLLLYSALCERLTASTRCMQFATLAAAALLAAEAWGVSSALAKAPLIKAERTTLVIVPPRFVSSCEPVRCC